MAGVNTSIQSATTTAKGLLVTSGSTKALAGTDTASAMTPADVKTVVDARVQQYYGVSWDESADTYVRTGSTAGQTCGVTLADAFLPVHRRMRGCVVKDDGTVAYYLCATDWTKKEDGTTASNLDGTDGQVMVEIPKFWYRYGYSGTTHTWEVSPVPLTGFKVHEMFMSDAHATGIITSDGTIPSDADTVTIGSKTYTFKTVLTPTEGEVLIDGSAAVALDNLKSAIMHTGTPDTDYKCAAAHPEVLATDNTNTTQTVVSILPGTVGNTYGLAVSDANMSVSAAYMAGGSTTEKDYVYVGAYEASLYDVSAAKYVGQCYQTSVSAVFATSDDSITIATRTGWATALAVGQKLVITGTSNNNATVTVKTIESATKITVDENLTDETAATTVIQTQTDVTDTTGTNFVLFPVSVRLPEEVQTEPERISGHGLKTEVVEKLLTMRLLHNGARCTLMLSLGCNCFI